MRQRIDAIANAYRIAAGNDPRLPLWLVLAFGLPLVAGTVAGLLLGGLLLWLGLGLLIGLLAAAFVFGRRVQSAQFAQIEGMPGAAAAVLQAMRGQWWVTPAVAVTKKQEMVHRVVGRCGIVLVTEGGAGARMTSMVDRERKKLNRVRGEAPVHVVHSGDGSEGTVALGKLQVELSKLPGALSKTEVPKLAKRLATLDKGNIPMPKGAIPRGGRPR